MKKRALALAAAAVLLAGCADTTSGKTENVENETNKVSSENEFFEASEDELFMGDVMITDEDGFWKGEESYVVNGAGKKVIAISDTLKDIVKIDGKEYALERQISSRVLKNDGYESYYKYKYNYRLFDGNGTLVGEIDEADYCQHITDGRFIVYKYDGGTVDITNIFTGESQEFEDVERIFNKDEVVALLYRDSDGIKGISAADGTDYVELYGYDYGYSCNVNGKEAYVCCVKKEYSGENDTDILKTDGTKLFDKSFVSVNANADDMCYLLAYDGEKTIVINCDIGEVEREIDAEVMFVYKDGSYIARSIEENESGSRNVYGIFAENGEVISDGWDGYTYTSNDGVEAPYYFMERKEVQDGYSGYMYRWVTYVLNEKGEIVSEPINEKGGWVDNIFENFFTVSHYNDETGNYDYFIYDYNGNEIKLEKDYLELNRVYIYGNNNDVLFAKYENPVSQGYLYDVLNQNLEVIFEGAGYVSYNTQDKTAIPVTKGFEMGIIDSESGKWIYKESRFTNLDD